MTAQAGILAMHRDQFRKMRKQGRRMNEGSLDNETALVTGGTDGIGKAIARGLATMGAEVFIVGSDPDKGRRAERELRAAAGHHRVYFLQADLSLMRETDRLADEVVERVPRLNRLVLCAGVVRGQRMETKEGVESNFAVNYLSRFVLTGRVLKLLEAGGTRGRAARIVVIGGTAMNGKIHYDDINLARSFGYSHSSGSFARPTTCSSLSRREDLPERATPASPSRRSKLVWSERISGAGFPCG